jgi:hypothetical protein
MAVAFPGREEHDLRMSSLTPAATRLMLIQRRDTVAAARRPANATVRRYRLARMALNPRPRTGAARYEHLRCSYD